MHLYHSIWRGGYGGEQQGLLWFPGCLCGREWHPYSASVSGNELGTHLVELQRQFLALRRTGALPLQARLERRSLSSGALLTHRKLSFIFSLGASLPPFLPNQVTLQLHFHYSHKLYTLSKTFHSYKPGSIQLSKVWNKALKTLTSSALCKTFNNT